jgi:hypothetical protein
MPSWTDNLQQDHRWTGRQLIGVDDETDDEVESSMTRPIMVERSSGNAARRMLIEDDASSDDTDNQEDLACDMALTSQLSFDSQWQTPPWQNRVGKRTLLTAEEMEDSDEFDEQDEEDDIELESSEPSNPFQQLAISRLDNEDESAMEDTAVPITMSTRDFAFERDTDAVTSGVEDSPRIPSSTVTDYDVYPRTTQDMLDEDILALATAPVITSQDRAEDSGRVQESPEQEDEPSHAQVIALKRK